MDYLVSILVKIDWFFHREVIEYTLSTVRFIIRYKDI